MCFNGPAGLAQFFEQVRIYARHSGGLICVSGVNEDLFLRHHEGDPRPHIESMAEIARMHSNFQMQILVEEGE